MLFRGPCLAVRATPVASPPGNTVLTYVISADANDCFYRSNISQFGANAVASGTNGADVYHGGFRFPAVAVGQGVVPLAATITFVQNGAGGSANVGALKGALVDNLAVWDEAGPHPFGVDKTTASTALVKGTLTYSVLAQLIEIFARPGRVSGDAVGIVADGTDTDGFVSWVDYGATPAQAARLVITLAPP